MRLPRVGLPLILLAIVAVPSGAAAPLPGEGPAVLAGGGRQQVAMVDEITSPVRWTGGGWRWQLGLELPLAGGLFRGGYRRAVQDVTLDGVDLPDTIVSSPYRHVREFAERSLVIEDLWLDARWRVSGSPSGRLELGAFARLRGEYHGDTDYHDADGYAAISLGPLLRYGWRPDARTELGAEASFSLMAWLLRTPYLGYDLDWVWQDEVRLRTFNDFVQARLDLTARRALSERLALELALRAEYAWSDVERRYASLVGVVDLSLIVGW